VTSFYFCSPSTRLTRSKRTSYLQYLKYWHDPSYARFIQSVANLFLPLVGADHASHTDIPNVYITSHF
jgi:hypothetical protein